MSSDARPPALDHANEELLEEYSFGRIREPQLGWLEEHLLICPQCQAELDDIEEYKVFMKAGLSSFESERRASAGPLSSATEADGPDRLLSALGRRLAFYFALPRMPLTNSLCAAALLLVLAGGTAAWRMQSSALMAPVPSIQLIALRGGEGDVARAPSGRPLDLVFDRTDLPADMSYRAEVMNSSGRRMWSGSVRVSEEHLSIRVEGPLRTGQYWVRLYSSTGQLLREFALNVG